MNETIQPHLALEASVIHHLTFTIGKDPEHASLHDWRMALSYAIRDRVVDC